MNILQMSGGVYSVETAVSAGWRTWHYRKWDREDINCH